MAFLTRVLRRYSRIRPGTRDHLPPANRPFTACRPCRACPRMPRLMYPPRTRGALSVLRTQDESVAETPLPRMRLTDLPTIEG
jgi:hypothetical protein